MRKILPFVLIIFAAACKPSECYTDIKDTPYDPIFDNASLATPYHTGDISDTPAPDGYKPFYISHYGRHGSRYYTFSVFKTLTLIDYLSEAEAQENLTEKGGQLLREVRFQHSVLSRTIGSLTARGCREHRNIAARMALRFPEVWKDGGDVYARASTSGGRCITSMCCSCSELQKRIPDLNFTFEANDGIYKLLCPLGFPTYIRTESDANMNQEIKDSVNAPAIVGRLLKKPTAYQIGQSGFICKLLVEEWSFGGCMDTVIINIENYMTRDEIAKCAACRDDVFYAAHGNSDKFGQDRTECNRVCLDDFIIKADEVIEGRAQRVADLRYGHDSGLSPLLVLMQAEPFAHPYSFTETHLHWKLSQYVPMAANIQLVFYRKDSASDILVKMLLNEEETPFAGIEPVCGPYYKWNDVKSLWQRKKGPSGK